MSTPFWEAALLCFSSLNEGWVADKPGAEGGIRQYDAISVNVLMPAIVFVKA
jgi:hypothetical protein